MPKPKERILLPEPFNSKVAGVISEIEEISAKKAWFTVRNLDESDYILTQAKPYLNKFSETSRPDVFSNYSVRDACRLLRDCAFDLAKEYGRLEIWSEAWERAHDASFPILKAAAGNAVSGDNRRSDETTRAYDTLIKSTGISLGRIAAWETVSDLPELEGIENPDRSLLDLYRLGLIFVNFRFFDHTQVAVAHQITKPEQNSPDRFLVCLPENQRLVHFKHGLNMYCKDGVPITNTTPS